MDALSVIVLLVLMFTVAAVVVALEDGHAERGKAAPQTTSHTGDLRDQR